MLDQTRTPILRAPLPTASRPAGRVLRRVAWCEPAEAFVVARRVAPSGLSFLDSADAPGPRSRWSYLALDPELRLVAEDPSEAPARLAALAGWLAERARPPDPAAPPFTGGAVGLIGYDAACALHGLRSRHPSGELPALHVGLYDRVIAFDRLAREVWIAAPDRAAAGWLEALLEDARGSVTEPASVDRLDWTAVTTPARHRAAVAEIVEAIAAGALFQANYTTAHRAPRPPGLDLTALYLRLRGSLAAPFSAFVDLGGVGETARALLSASPERFLRLDADGRVEARPIKGTAARLSDPRADAAAAAALAASDKDRAENLMIVDLMRNDLARVARIGSVRVPQLNAVESFAAVHHLVSCVTAELAPGCGAVDLLRACLPGGSITGAPKRAAMQLIDRVENRARDAYCGSVVRIGDDGAMDSSIVIRSLGVGEHWLGADAGGGITAGSDPQAEYDEAQLKLARLIAP
ncbi:para-aminobenzoate synthetase component 1 [Endobacter medicaginis]|uniref:Para-aminobenzoate synthetase component 1 n=2 Tax=Endobacter medicaginis TaxID=1181271 RepID=A0A839V0R2_9PROT|nr:anthranilate synthase component I family protein [Endobacter medicaginis]MBB3174010.1 para-aminobenzoate synthetase component 1 [Endobacter medicaginis]MCX5475133.1 anthranilate synthase component I family protein [Endobacter medicaginis]